MSITSKISIIGTGKMAHAMGRALLESGVCIVEVAGRNAKKGRQLAEDLGAKYVKTIECLSSEIDAFAVLVSDDAISSVSYQIPSGVCQFHTSGVTEAEKLSSEVKGVVWPIKSINEKSINEGFQGVPMGIEASNQEFADFLFELAQKMGAEAFTADSETKAVIHLAAVFTDNFANHCLTLSQEVLKNANLDTGLMKSLAEGLAKGGINGDSASRQTGVAHRGDLGSQKKHISLLHSEETIEFYKFLSKHIAEHHELQD